MADIPTCASTWQMIADYGELRPIMKYGLHVLPDHLDISIWHGVIFCHSGRYKGGIFRFIICAHPAYPADGARPLVVFLDKPHHYLVCKDTGMFQYEARFQQWKSGRDRLPPVIAYMHAMLMHDSIPEQPDKSYNSHALHDYVHNPSKFESDAAESATASLASVLCRTDPRSGFAVSTTRPEVELEKYLSLKSPLTSTTIIKPSNSECKAAAQTATHIGLARGFRLSEPAPYHHHLAEFLASRTLRGSEVMDVLVRGMAMPGDDDGDSRGSPASASSLNIGPTKAMLEGVVRSVSAEPAVPPLPLAKAGSQGST